MKSYADLDAVGRVRDKAHNATMEPDERADLLAVLAQRDELLEACKAIVACSKYWANAFSGERKALQLAQSAITKTSPHHGQAE